MHDIKAIAKSPDKYRENLARRKFDLSILEAVIEGNERRKKLVLESETNRSEVKKLSKEIGKIKGSGGDAKELMSQVSQLKSSLEGVNKELEALEKLQSDTLAVIPNLLDDEVPEGKGEEDNKLLKEVGEKLSFDFEPKEHWELGEDLGMLDFEAASKLTGSRFCVYKGALARMERALINYFLDSHIDCGYEEIIPPYIVNENTMYGTGQLPKFEDDLFKIEGKSWYLIPTAEVPLTNLKKGELFKGEELPFKYCAYTPCFRSEAGSYGKDTKGLIRQHQFNKVELVNIVAEDKSKEAHDAMLERACAMLEGLGLTYKVMLLCSADIGFGAMKCFDLEVWLPGQGKFREISSISNCGEFQGRRASIRYRNAEGKPTFVHTLNGSGLAVGRALVAVMENYQNADGSITVPEVLRGYMGGVEQIKA